MEEVTITVVEFYAFNMKIRKPYINEVDENILLDLEQICNTNRLVSINKYKATLVESKEFTVDEGVKEQPLQDDEPVKPQTTNDEAVK